MIQPTTRAWCLRNNSSQEISTVSEPWLNTEPIPAFKTKDLYREWAKHPETDYPIFCMVEGTTPSLRVGASNPVYRIHGFVADFDCPGLTADEVQKAIGRIPPQFSPFAFNQTFSGGLRIVWRLEQPILYHGLDAYVKLIQRVVKEIKMKSIAPNLDDAIEVPEIYYVSGANWTINPSAIIPTALAELWLFDVLKQAKLDDNDGPDIPIEIIAAEVQKRFPNRWGGDFVEGARGVRFWETGADAKSAIIRKHGMVCFTGFESFISWEKILGREFVQEYRASRLGRALSEMYSDGDVYFRKLPDSRWDACAVTNARRHLKIHYGLSERVPKGEDNSEVEQVLHQLEMSKRINGVLPFPLNPESPIRWNDGVYLNNSSAKMCAIHPEPQEWGLHFPWIASYLTTLFLDEKNLGAFLSWLHVWVKSAATGKPCRGQSVFLAGPPGTGKSLLSRQILARIFGGYADASKNFVGGNKYNSAMFDKALWCIDDSKMLTDHGAHAVYSSMVKAVAANDSFEYEAKYGYSGSVPFVGRLFVTLNNDAMSLGALPNTELSLAEKVFMLLTDDCEADVEETEEQRYAVIDRELPFFVRWVQDMELPAWVQKDSRFGIKAWHDPQLIEEARAVTPSATILDVVEDWWESFDITAEGGKSATEMRFTATKLYQTLDSNYHSVIGRMSPITLGKHLSQCINNGCPWMSTAISTGKKYYVFKKL